eukprot:641223-Rhodomonas_salina.1
MSTVGGGISSWWGQPPFLGRFVLKGRQFCTQKRVDLYPDIGGCDVESASVEAPAGTTGEAWYEDMAYWLFLLVPDTALHVPRPQKPNATND